jgi:formate hydrogenlyase transcriptional activator
LPARHSAHIAQHIGLVRHSWSGNIRELQNFIERAVILSGGPVLQVSNRDLSSLIAAGQNCDDCQTMEDVKRKHILATLNQTNWIVSRTATRLGMNRSTLHFRMKKLGIVRRIDASMGLS